MVDGEYPVVMSAPAGQQGSVVLSCPMDARLAAQIMQLLARAGWEFDRDAMRAEGVPMPATQAGAARDARDLIYPPQEPMRRGPDPRPET